MRNLSAYFATITLLVVPTLAMPQQSATETQPSEKLAGVVARVDQQANPAPQRYYKLSYVLRETDEGKVLNQRTFVVTINPATTNAQGEITSRWWSLRAGTRVPYSTGTAEDGKFSYADVGVNLDSRGYEAGDALQLEVSSEISSLGEENAGSPTLPLIRQIKVRSAALAPFGKSTAVFMADDPASKHRFELDVTPVRER